MHTPNSSISTSKSESIGHLSVEPNITAEEAQAIASRVKSPTTLGIFPAPPSPLDHFEKWFPTSPGEAPEPLLIEKAQPRCDKSLPQPPYHVFDRWKKRQLVVLVSFAGILSPLSTSIYFPTLTAISKDLNVSVSMVLLTITVYMLVQAIAPFFWMPICSTFGRRPTFIITLLIFLGANIGLIFTKGFLALTILRGVQSIGTAALTATCAAVIGDISTSTERSQYIGLFGGILMFTFISPMIGGVLTSYLGWRTIFWFLAGYGLAVLVLIILVLPETLRSIAGNGTIRLSCMQRPLIHMIRPSPDTTCEPDTRSKFKVPLTFLSARSFVEPLYCLGNRDIFLASLFGAIAFAICTTVIATTTTMFSDHFYHLSYMFLGLAFLPAGAGSVLSFFSIGYLMDYDFRVTQDHYREMHRLEKDTILDYKNLSDFPIERARLRNMWWITLIFVGTVGGYGFTFELSQSMIAVPLILQFFIASSATAMLLMNGILIGDLYKGSISVTPAVNFLRFLAGAAAVGTIQLAIDGIGAGFAFLALGVVMLGATPIMICQWFFGKPWTARRNSTWPRQRLIRMPDFAASKEVLVESVKSIRVPSRVKSAFGG
ncbi:major facilitator superfamily domain-containing protein [Amylocarpus encephaloides]|uniref:Major facilitator superfamily domain-containing protein n=1 Tax=Amylocarpus encephaloides TaxID=45428 RepID=A0A9P7YCN1_9HELO|nr:major facilitator superfamily domain-containing protein [Amylocarpus encephaloides]